MNPYGVMDGYLTLLAVAVVLAFLYGPWQRLVVDVIRQRLFELRDAGFDAAADGKFAFQDMHYKAFRLLMNTLIRHAEGMTLWRCLLAAIALRNIPSPASASGEQRKEIPGELKGKFVSGCMWAGALIWLRSPVLMLITPIVLLVLLVLGATSATVRALPLKLALSFKQEVMREAEAESGQKFNFA